MMEDGVAPHAHHLFSVEPHVAQRHHNGFTVSVDVPLMAYLVYLRIFLFSWKGRKEKKTQGCHWCQEHASADGDHMIILFIV